MSSDLPDFAREVEGPFVEGEPVKYDEGKIDEKIPPLQLQLGDLHARRLEMLQVKDDAAKRQTVRTNLSMHGADKTLTTTSRS